jgi:transposase-like protein
MNEAKDLRFIQCPYCGSDILHKHGTYRGYQRFICVDCKKTFTSYSSTIINRTHYDDPDWIEFLTHLANNKSMREISKLQGIHYLTANNWRIKVMHAIIDEFPKIHDFYDKFSLFYLHNEDLLGKNLLLLTVRQEDKMHTFIIDEEEKKALKKEINPNQFISKDHFMTSDYYYDHFDLYLQNLKIYIQKQRRLKDEFLQPYIYLFDVIQNEEEHAVKFLYDLLLSE